MSLGTDFDVTTEKLLFLLNRLNNTCIYCFHASGGFQLRTDQEKNRQNDFYATGTYRFVCT